MHISVLLNQCIDNLNLQDNSIIVDCTLGRAGHSKEILKKISNGYLYAFDQDIEAIENSKNVLNSVGTNYEIIKSNFVNLKEELKKRNVEEVDGVFFDLGVSSPQLDEKDRGFSFHQDAILDMRMDKDNPLTAKIVVNTYDYSKLKDIFTRYGEEKYASSIARNIIKEREIKEINTTLELVSIIQRSVPFKYSREKHPARKVFQAIRIEVNDELNVFESSLKQALKLLKINGRVCVITFHSLEDKICKKLFNEVSKVDPNLKNMPIIPVEYMPNYKIINVIEPSAKEIEENPRSRSAKLRVIERVK